MRILHVIRSVDPAGGGPIEGVTQLAVRAREEGHHVEIASLDPPESRFGGTTRTPVHRLGPGFGKYGYNGLLVRWVKQNAPYFDIVVVNGIWQYHSFAVWRVLRRSNIPYVVFTHGMLDPWFKRRYPLKHLKKWLYWPWGEYRVLRDAAAVIFTSADERILARQSFWLYRAHEVVVDYGTIRPPDDHSEQELAMRVAFPALLGKRIALFLGRIHMKKACDLVIAAFARELAVDPSWHLVMAGPDHTNWRPELEDLARKKGVADRITWTGAVTGPLKWGLLRAAEVFVLPSHQENFGIAVAEAIGCGVPVLISNKVNIWREIEGEGGGLVAADTIEGLSEIVRQWVSLTDDQRLTMSDNARRCFERHFDLRHASSNFLGQLSAISSAYHRAAH